MNQRIKNKQTKAHILSNVASGIKRLGLEEMEKQTAKFGPIDYTRQLQWDRPSNSFSGRFA